MNDIWQFLTESDTQKLAKNPIAQKYIKEQLISEFESKSKTWQQIYIRLSKNDKVLKKLSKK